MSRSFLIALPRTADPSVQALRSMLVALGSVPWVHLVQAATLVTEANRADPLATTAPSTWPVDTPAASGALLSRVDRLRPTVEAVAALLPSRSGENLRWQDTLDQLTSTRWRGHAGDVTALADAAQAWAASATRGIRVVSQDTNFLADEGILQVTVVNDLADPVTGLLVHLVPTNPRLRVVAQPDPVTIAARSRATVKVRVRAVAAGLVPVTVSLTSSGGLPVGTSAQLTIRANPPGRTFYLVSGGVLLLLVVGGVVRSVRQRRRPATGP